MQLKQAHPVFHCNLLTMDKMMSCIVNSCGDISISAVPSLYPHRAITKVGESCSPRNPYSQHVVRSCLIIPEVTSRPTEEDSQYRLLFSCAPHFHTNEQRKVSGHQSILDRHALGDQSPCGRPQSSGTCTPKLYDWKT